MSFTVSHELLKVADEHADAVRDAIAQAQEMWDEWEDESGEKWGPAGEIEEHNGPDGFTLFDRHESGTDYGCNTLTESGRLDDVLSELGIKVPYEIVTADYHHPYSASGSRDRNAAARNLRDASQSIE